MHNDKRLGINKMDGSHRQGPAVCDFPRQRRQDLISAYASHRGSRGFDAGGHDAGGVWMC